MFAKLACWVTCLIAAAPISACIAGTSARQPNVVLILADDLGWADLGCYGADVHETPHLDQLAREGLRFTQAYAMPVCSPSRASILTGRHAARLQMTIWREGALRPTQNRKLLPAPAITDLPHAETTIAEALKSAGYLPFHVGKCRPAGRLSVTRQNRLVRHRLEPPAPQIPVKHIVPVQTAKIKVAPAVPIPIARSHT